MEKSAKGEKKYTHTHIYTYLSKPNNYKHELQIYEQRNWEKLTNKGNINCLMLPL